MAVKKGRFYFKLTSNGNLLGEYSNEDMGHSGTEGAVRDPSSKANELGEKSLVYVGTYHSCWLDNDMSPCYTTLVIKPIGEKQSNFYKLTWTPTEKSSAKFEGEGMLCDDILIGYYK